jgi:hypothetical protein
VHVHLTYILWPDSKSGALKPLGNYVPDAILANARATLMAGFTTVQSLGAGRDKPLRDAIAAGVVVTKYGHAPDGPFSDNITIYEAGHPVPDENGVEGTIKAAFAAEEYNAKLRETTKLLEDLEREKRRFIAILHVTC